MKINSMKQSLIALAMGLGGIFASISGALAASSDIAINAPIVQPKARVGTGFGDNNFRGFNTNAATQYELMAMRSPASQQRHKWAWAPALMRSLMKLPMSP
jgi:hypothetical protein